MPINLIGNDEYQQIPQELRKFMPVEEPASVSQATDEAGNSTRK